MAFLRKYEYNDKLQVLTIRFYRESLSKEPSMLITITLDKRTFTVVRSLSVSSTIVLDEINRAFELLEYPHWKSFINAHSVTYNELFET